jgi:hypothetical protein
VHRLVGRQRIELRFELRLHRRRPGAERRVGLAAAKAHRRLADGLDAGADLLARLLGDDLAEEPPEQATVVAEKLLFFLGQRGDGGVYRSSSRRILHPDKFEERGVYAP